MRRLLSALAVTTTVPVLLAVPVASRPHAHPHAVDPRLTVVTLAATHAHHGVIATSAARMTPTFGLVGASWAAGASTAGERVEVRVHQRGRWSGWSTLSATDVGADLGTPDARRAEQVTGGKVVAEPIWVGRSDGVQSRVVTTGSAPATAPRNLHVVLVDGGTSPADADPGPGMPLGTDLAAAAQAQPTIYTRADWGADESLRKNACPSGPDYGTTITMGFVHHTDNANDYSRSDVPAIIRSIYAYHVKSNGWCDIGYNYLVDRFGRVWEGRYGGITRAVIGAHTGGFNTDTFGVSLIGNFTSAAPTSAMLSALEHLFAWRLGGYYRDPLGKTKVVAGYFSGSRYATGDTVTFNTISGHRDADFTTCPGSAAYADLPGIRTGVKADMGAGFVNPSVTPTSRRMASGSVSVASKVVGAQSWTMTVTDAAGTTVLTKTGSANRSTPVSTSWNLKDAAGTPMLPGSYHVTLTGGTTAGATALPFSATVTVTPPVTVTAPAQVALNRPTGASGTGRPGGQVDVHVVSNGVDDDLGTVAVSSSGAWSLGTKVTAAHDLSWRVIDPASGYVAKRRTLVAPSITSPSTSPMFVAAGGRVSLQGTALPDNANTVTLLAQPAGATSPTSAPAVLVAPDGSWSVVYTPTRPTTLWVKDSRSLKSSTRLVYPVSAPTASAPSSGYAGRSVVVRGNAGNAPVDATLWAQQGSSWTTVKTVAASTSGAFSARLPLPASGASSQAWKVTTGYGSAARGSVAVLATFPPTATGPARVPWDATRTVSGTAVPGDVVTVWTAPPGTTSWVQAGSTKTDSAKTWSFPLTFTSDVQWRVTSASGHSPTLTTVIVPTITAPRTSTAGATVLISGRGIPGQSLTLSRAPAGTTTWTPVKTVTVRADGTWSVKRWPPASTSWRATSHGQTSRTVTISVS